MTGASPPAEPPEELPADDQPTPRPRGSKPRRRRRQPVSFSIGTQDFVQTGLRRFDPHDPYYFAVSIGWGAFLLLFLAVELAINTLFALLYLAVPGSVTNARPGVFTDVFFFSLETLATVGYGVMAPATLYGHLVSGAEIITGVIFTAIMTGLLFVRFSKPKARISYADNPVVTRHDGRPTLMLRVGNARSSILTNARFTLHVLTPIVSNEGRVTRALVELPMTRAQLPIFAILWTLMHVIDEDSALYGLDAAAMVARDMRFFITIAARDHATGQEISDVRIYTGEDLRFGMHYADAIKIGADKRATANYALIGALEADE